MERKAKQLPSANLASAPDSSSSSSPPSPGFLRNVQAAFKRHRPLSTMQINSIVPRRTVCPPQREVSRNVQQNAGHSMELNDSRDAVPIKQSNTGSAFVGREYNAGGAIVENRDDGLVAPVSVPDTATKSFDKNFDPQRDQPKPDVGSKEYSVDAQYNMQLPVGRSSGLQGPDDKLATGVDKLSSHMGSLALTEMEWDACNQVENSAIIDPDINYKKYDNMDCEVSLKSDGAASSLLAKRTMVVQGQVDQLKSFLSQPVTQSSVMGSSSATTTSVHSTSAPILSSTTCLSHNQQDCASHAPTETLGDLKDQSQPCTRKDVQDLQCSVDDSGVLLADQVGDAFRCHINAINKQMEFKESNVLVAKKSTLAKKHEMPIGPSSENKSIGGGNMGDVIDVQSQALLSKNSHSDMKQDTLKTDKAIKQEKNASSKGTTVSRKRNYDPDSFFKVNGKLYQRLGKIGSGGSSEVHKVISSDCTIYALKKIKLKGRDHATAYGFCQEIEYLNKLKGKDHIIQLIDFEVTDKTLLREVLSGIMNNKDSRIRDDGCIYMVLEYGEIDLAHMLSQKWKEIEGSEHFIDENWLRFYWQQILLAVNTIHEERIVHSDLKPANFLLVKGSLKLIDFGIAKAIMSDTTNIQRDSQVGTLSYMSPEAFMCNERDEKGNTIKCGRPSDIWSLGCILYQMVYGRTPFADYKTFWAKFKVITDPNHEIVYEPLSNPWLIDLMKKCLAWDRNERWRIPQLLKHPFLNPPVLLELPPSQGQNSKLLQHLAEVCGRDQEAKMLCSQLQQVLTEPVLSSSRDQLCSLLVQISKLWSELHDRLANIGEG